MHSTANVYVIINDVLLFFVDVSNLYASEIEHSSMYWKFSSTSLMYAENVKILIVILMILIPQPVFDLVSVDVKAIGRCEMMSKKSITRNEMLLTTVLP